MSGVTEIQSRIQAIQTRVSSPPIAGRFNAIYEAQLAAANAQTTATPVDQDSAVAAESFAVDPLGMTPTAVAHGSQAVTLGMMLGTTPGPATMPSSATVVTAAGLAEYMALNDIEGRNGRLSVSELSEVSGAWNGTGYLLPPAARAWEEMRADAAIDGIDLRAIDTYRSWESQNRAYQAHLRGEKAANVLPPGTSEHGNGLAVDVTNGHLVGVGDEEYTWLRTYAAQYGWHPISNESWHWEFRGTTF